MKERFEGLTAWKEKQRQEKDFLEKRLEEARRCIETLTVQNQELSKRPEAGGGAQVRTTTTCFILLLAVSHLKPQSDCSGSHVVDVCHGVVQSERGGRRPARPGGSTAGGEERPGGPEL